MAAAARPWFFVLPDCSAAGAAASLDVKATKVVPHPSGRPWLVGSWPDEHEVVGRSAHATIVLLGEHRVEPEQLAEAAARVSTLADVDRISGSLAGSFHLIASVGGTVRFQGSLSSHRQVFHGRLGSVSVAADRAHVLARLLGADLDEERLAVCLLDPPALHPVTGQPVWRGVDLVPSAHYLRLDDVGRARVIRWWRPPDPVLPMGVGAPAFADALSSAVAVRVTGRALVSADLGGLDSTAVSCLGAQHVDRVLAYTITNDDPGDDELRWARQTAAGVANLEHHVVPREQLPITYDGLLGLDVPPDEPCLATVDLARFRVVPQLASSEGSRMHLTGFGGDELLTGSAAHLHRMVRTKPRVALRLIRGFAVKGRWPYRDVLRQLADNRSYSVWAPTTADNITASAPDTDLGLGWGPSPRLPPWVMPEAAQALRNLIRAGVRNAEPLAEDRGRHNELQLVGAISRIVAQLAQVAAGLGITLAVPFHDDRVIEAALAVRPEDRISPWRYKPLIAEAMRGVVPAGSLTRHTKSDGSCHEDLGLRKNRGDLLALCDGLRLAQLGLVDEDRLRDACLRPAPLPEQIGLLYQTVACEVWLRSLDRAASASGRSG